MVSKEKRDVEDRIAIPETIYVGEEDDLSEEDEIILEWNSASKSQ